MSYYRFSSIPIAFFLFFLLLPFSFGQDIPATPSTENTAESDPAKPLEIKLSVNEVRLDVVVLDKKGYPITDLTADDFEVFQDNRRQEILASVYINNQSDAATQPATGQKELAYIPSQPAKALKKEDVHRTIMFIIDDFAMTFENIYNTKMALRNFVEKQMQPGDLVAVLTTNYGNSALNTFYSDKRELLARINTFTSLYSTRDILLEEKIGIGYVVSNQINSFSYSLRVLKNMPGRKILIMVAPVKWNDISFDWYSNITAYMDHFNEMADDALRAGVVVNLVDIDGLYTFRAHGADASIPFRPSFNGQRISSDMYQLLGGGPLFFQTLPAPVPRPNPMPRKTGGVYIEDSNFFLEGIGREVESLMSGYYLVSYTPPTDTFKKSSGRDDYRRLKVNVKRKDAKVYTRDGFFGRLDNETAADTSKQNPLIDAIYSPFQSTDLNVDIAAGFVNDANSGYLVRSWIHLDPRDVKIIETEEGHHIDIEAVYVASDINGNIQDSNRVEFTLSKFDVDWVRKHGIRFSMLLPVKKPGPFYIRISIQDKETGKVGSAYQFLEIPDLKKKGHALSNIFMITSADDLVWMNSEVTEETVQGVFFPMFQDEEVRSPALRTYKPGDTLHTLTMLYNADAQAISRSEIETQTVLYKDGKELVRNESRPINPAGVKDTNNIPILQQMTLGTNTAPGDYMLQLLVTDKKNSKNNEGTVYQTLSFTVVEK